MLKLAGEGILSFSKVPLKISIYVGILCSLSSFLYGIWLLFYFIKGGSNPEGWTTLALLILLIGGIQLIVIGIIGEYVGAIYDNVKKRPHYIIDEIID